MCDGGDEDESGMHEGLILFPRYGGAGTHIWGVESTFFCQLLVEKKKKEKKPVYCMVLQKSGLVSSLNVFLIQSVPLMIQNILQSNIQQFCTWWCQQNIGNFSFNEYFGQRIS